MNSGIDRIHSDITCHMELGLSLKGLTDYVEKHNIQSAKEELDNITTEYNMMKEFFLNGYKDEKRAEVYEALMKRLNVVAQNIRVSYMRTNNKAYADALALAKKVHLDREVVKNTLAKFQSDAAMIMLEHQGEEQHKLLNEVYARQHDFMASLFSAIFIAKQWQEATADFYVELITSPILDRVNASTLVSAVMLSCMGIFDINKLRALCQIYSKAQDEYVRQRALVGLAFSVPSLSEYNFYEDEIKAMLAELFVDNEKASRELLDTQKQVFYCMNADKDSETIQKDIMPKLTKQSTKFRFGRQIQENEEDKLQDILHPEAEDDAMEQMEKNFERMMDMQKKGADIYFGGFAQMKRYPFFYQLINWFVPFYFEHPALANVREKFGDNSRISDLLQTGPFCNSDKYSFALSISFVYDNMPDEMKKMLTDNNAMWRDFKPEQNENPAFIRHMYLQDLYRFFRLYPNKECFKNPFVLEKGSGVGFFMHQSAFYYGMELDDCKLELSKFLFKQGRYEELRYFMSYYPDEPYKSEYARLEGLLLFKEEKYREASDKLKEVSDKFPDDEYMHRCLARSCFYNFDYDDSVAQYDLLLKIAPDNIGYALNGAIACLKEAVHTYIYDTAYYDEEFFDELEEEDRVRNAEYCDTMDSYEESIKTDFDYDPDDDAETRIAKKREARYAKAHKNLDEAMQRLFKLNYEHPDNIHITRALGWGYIQTKQPEKALEVFKKLDANGQLNKDDIVNMGYSYWFQGMLHEAVDTFRRIPLEEDEDMRRAIALAFIGDSDLLEDIYEVSDLDKTMIIDSCVF